MNKLFYLLKAEGYNVNLERFLKTYPNDKNLVYAHYLIGMCYYETIEDEKRDSGPLNQAKIKFKFISLKESNKLIEYEKEKFKSKLNLDLSS